MATQKPTTPPAPEPTPPPTPPAPPAEAAEFAGTIETLGVTRLSKWPKSVLPKDQKPAAERHDAAAAATSEPAPVAQRPFHSQPDEDPAESGDEPDADED